MRLDVTERAFQDQVMQLARILGWRRAHFRPAIDRHNRWKTPMQGEPGFPDLVLVRPPRLIFAELKSEKGKLAPAQAEWIADIRLVSVAAVDCCSFDGASPIEAHVWRPSDFDAIAEVLR